MRAFWSLAAAISLPKTTEPTPADRKNLTTVIRLLFAGMASSLVCGIWLLIVGGEAPLSRETSPMTWAMVAGGLFGLVASLPLVSLATWRRVSRHVGDGSLQRLLGSFPQSMRDDAEGLIREFADVRDRDRARGGAPWLTWMKCGCFLALYTLRTGIGLTLSALVGRLLRL